jgi:hypothetical protein
VSINLVFLGLATTASPLFLLVSVLMLAQSQRLREATALAIGWFLSIGACAAAVLLVGSALPKEDGHPDGRLLGLIDVVLAVVLALMALRFHRRAKRDPQAAVPKWLGRVGSMSVVVACGLGMFLPPTVLAFAAGNEIVQQHVSVSTEWVLVLIYAAIGSLLQFTPVLIVAGQPRRSAERLRVAQQWLETHWQQVMVVLFAVIALYLAGKGALALSR